MTRYFLTLLVYKGSLFVYIKLRNESNKNVKFKILGQDYKVYGKCLVYHLNILLCISQIYTLNLAASLSTNGVVIMSFYACRYLVTFSSICDSAPSIKGLCFIRVEKNSLNHLKT